ncbi:hypothetical protein PF003_g242 [Phytophthora fragariae]|nr:hypothetical protein PF003_g242 [Phytophthora fragariae]
MAPEHQALQLWGEILLVDLRFQQTCQLPEGVALAGIVYLFTQLAPPIAVVHRMVRAIAGRTRSVLATSFSVALELVAPARLTTIVRPSEGPSRGCSTLIVVRRVHMSVSVGRDFARI